MKRNRPTPGCRGIAEIDLEPVLPGGYIVNAQEVGRLHGSPIKIAGATVGTIWGPIHLVARNRVNAYVELRIPAEDAMSAFYAFVAEPD